MWSNECRGRSGKLPSPSRPGGEGGRVRFGRGVVGLLAVLVAWAAFSALSPFFLTGSNIMNVGSQVGPLAIAALGEMVVIITGGFDVAIGGGAAVVTVFTGGAPDWGGAAGRLGGPPA